MVEVAIVGMACRLPGGVDSPRSYWDFLTNKGDGIVDVPPDRWSIDKYYDPDPDAPGRMYTRKGGFLTQSLWDFDPEFFGISPREGSVMDPQQRLLLEVAWEALDDAGAAARVAGRPVGVYVGGFTNDSTMSRVSAKARPSIDGHTPTASSFTLLSNRISFALDLRGPSMTIDTACSSSLVAFHEATQAITRGECEAALVGGVNAMLQPETFVSMCKGRFLSADGRCKTFDATADGYGRGEGAGMVLLMPLDDAIRRGDRIYAVVRGTGVNQDGRTIALTVPNADAQHELAARVAAEAGIEPHRVGYVEAHGTGTAVGDPLEMRALGRAYGAVAARTTPLPVGAVKASIGHTEAAAGVASVIKSALTVYHRTLAPQAWLDTLNPEIPFDDLNLRVVTEVEPFPGTESAIVAVNGFGYGGTNAHVLLEQPPAHVDGPRGRRPRTGLLPLSGRHEGAVRDTARRLADLVESGADAHAVAEALWTRRAHHLHRAALPVDVPGASADLPQRLRVFADGDGRVTPRAVGADHHDPVFVFSGMGPQWWAMARDLLEHDGPFRDEALRIDDAFRRIAGWSIVEELSRPEDESRVANTAIAQPANFLVQVSLVAHLASAGVAPTAVAGHSVGEVSAAYVSGQLSLDDALLVSLHRARLQATTAGTGGMLAVGLPETDVLTWIPADGSVSIAAVNSPSSVTLAGADDALAVLHEQLTAEGLFSRRLRVEVPYHCHLMDPILPEIERTLASLDPRPPRVPLYSTVTAARVTDGAWDGAYWCDNVRRPVRFADTIAALIADGHRVFVEVGPHPVLSGNIREILVRSGESGAAVGTLVRDARDDESLLHTISGLFVAGVLEPGRAPVFGASADDSGATPHLDLPPYPWQRRRLWHEADAVARDRLGTADSFPMLGERTEAHADEWEVELSVARLPWLREHVVDGLVVLPGAAYLDAALSAARARTGRTALALEDVRFVAPLVVDAHTVPTLRLSVEPSTRRFTVSSRAHDGDAWTTNALGRLVEAPVVGREPQQAEAPATAGITADEHRQYTIDGPSLYAALAGRGLEYGASFRCIDRAHVDADEPDVVRAFLDTTHLAGDRHLAHPAAVDAALQCVALLASSPETGTGAVVPARVRSVHRVRALPDLTTVHVRRTGTAPLRADVIMTDATGNTPGATVLTMTGVEFRPVAPPAEPTARLRTLLYEPEWELRDPREQTAAATEARREHAVVVAFGDEPTPLTDALARSRPSAQVVVGTPASLDTTLVGDLLDAVRDGLGLPGVEQATLVVVPTDTWTAADNAYGLVAVARAAARTDAVRAVVVTHGALWLPTDTARSAGHAHPFAPLVGARRSLANEQPHVKWRLVDVGTDTRTDELVAETLGVGVFASDDADEVALRQGARWVIRMRHTYDAHRDEGNVPRPLTDADASFAVETPPSRLLTDLALRECARSEPGPGQIEVRIDAIGLNYKDPLKVMGLLTERELDGTYFGTDLALEASGTVVRTGPEVTEFAVGDRLGVGVRNMMRRYVTIGVGEGNTTAVPQDWQPGQCSSTLPYLTAEYGLVDLAHAGADDVVLVHGAAGGMGMAAVHVARRLGATVVATASTPERRAVAAEAGAHHTLDSRSVDFVDAVLRLTDGRGADVVYTSAPGEIAAQNLRAAAEFGRIVEIGKADIYGGGVLDLAPFDRNLSYFAVDMDRMLAHRPQVVRAVTRRVVDLLAQGVYPHLPYTTYPLDRIAEAFEAVARSTHTGRVVLALDSPEPAVRPRLPHVAIDPDGSYLVTGGFGAFGLAVARRLAADGARHLILASRSGPTTDAARGAVAELREAGVDVTTATLDVADHEQVHAAIAHAVDGPYPLRGVFHTAGLVDNRPVHDITHDSLRATFAPKVDGGWNLHRATVDAGAQLDAFVLFSSVSALTGGTPQLAYSAANASLDALASERRAAGLPALTVAWGSMSGGGMAEANDETVRYLALLGFRPIDMTDATAMLTECMRLEVPHVAVMDVDWEQWGATNGASRANPRFAEHIRDATAGGTGASALQAEILALPEDQRGDVVTYILAEQLAVVMGVPADAVDVLTPLPDLGMDSLMAIEFAARAGKTLGIEISVLEFGRGSGLSTIGTKLAATLAADGPPPATAPTGEVAAVSA
ncbi:type I polyketide synthase [Rhodococcus sp. HNM0569]|uniref:type I polyketide synthase n=1 Tax=Rhodococcus sp. HNM0569 TaxID=2716340 RepID=UPI00146C48B0|nr:type I polyketide synthase [Rhodococcus sp. HNM0569]NLU84206.1 SDR family NAD(P)-dependent oxidoreductase [Rhodococcus sp. HNM0569]